ncbi:MAG: single-stranded-DNA-specific exonuclease RecJ [Eggerthellaceae bacterium]|nr:single-stranded-DNA-specific exonuclease RecJ [Eggerthellaceae bacterium]
MTTRFRLRSCAPDAVARIQAAYPMPQIMARTLAGRGISSPEDIARLLEPSLADEWNNPYDMPCMQEIVDALSLAIDQRKHIVVFGDFDLDGISATSVLTRGLRALGAHATPFIPKRAEEGYGLTEAAIKRMMEISPDLVITVDCGIACAKEVEDLQDAGISVIVTDHHEASDAVPKSCPVCDPKAHPGHPSAILAGVGVALKVVQALGGARGYPHLWRSYTDLATLGTVADLMPMVGENRALVSDGLARMNADPRPCIAALTSLAKPDGKPLTSSNLSFSLIPRLNAAGRMGETDRALDLLMTDDYEEACALAAQLEEINSLRREKEAELAAVAKSQAAELYSGGRSIVVAGEGWHEGVKGIVASRLVGEYHVPAMLFSIVDGEARGSGRSYGQVNLFQAVESTSDMLTRFGGHGAAVGVTLPEERLPEFREALESYMRSLPPEQFDTMLDIDAQVRLSELTLENVSALERLAPFGQEFPEPRFLVRNVSLANARAVGAGKNHLSFQMTDGADSVSAIMFNCEEIERYLTMDCLCDVAFTVQVDEWRGRRNVKAMVCAISPAAACSAMQDMLDPSVFELFDDLFEACDGGDVCCMQREHMSDEPYPDALEDASASQRELKEHWQRVAQSDPDALEQELIRAIIGNGQLHPAQREILDRLRAGESTLGVMATGRGKSLVFQVHAAMLALRYGKASLFVYPLRALMADQAYHMSTRLAAFGLECRVLNGECEAAERERIYQELASGDVDIVMTTPEFLSFHADRLSIPGRIGFFVVDEAHHIGQSKAGTRPAYSLLGNVIQKLGDPLVLALTATAPADVANAACKALYIKERVLDDSSRDNLHLDDRRNVRNRDDYLAHIIAGGGKCVIYVNSREQSVGVARRLRRRVPQLALQIGFYNAALSRSERKRIEDLFREGQLQVLVATSAFGEGIDIPDIRHVVLYHMPFSDVEFNQMSGRAGRDGKDAWVHLLYGRADVTINENILSEMTPARDIMARIYTRMRSLQAECPGQMVSMAASELARLASDDFCLISAESARCGISVFSELGLIDSKLTFSDGHEICGFRVHETESKVELTDSVRYQEGLDEQQGFRDFCEWAMMCDAPALIQRIIHPIIPDDQG